MNKIEEIIRDLGYGPANVFTTRFSFEIEDIELICKKYAEYYAERCLEIAANEAKIQINSGTGIERVLSLSYSEYNILHECFIDDRTITNIKLPEHD